MLFLRAIGSAPAGPQQAGQFACDPTCSLSHATLSHRLMLQEATTRQAGLLSNERHQLQAELQGLKRQLQAAQLQASTLFC